MSYCQCGGYLGSGGIDGYAGRWCKCAAPIAGNFNITTSDKISFSGTCDEIIKDLENELDHTKNELCLSVARHDACKESYKKLQEEGLERIKQLDEMEQVILELRSRYGKA